jgi:hypothetical protein
MVARKLDGGEETRWWREVVGRTVGAVERRPLQRWSGRLEQPERLAGRTGPARACSMRRGLADCDGEGDGDSDGSWLCGTFVRLVGHCQVIFSLLPILQNQISSRPQSQAAR